METQTTADEMIQGMENNKHIRERVLANINKTRNTERWSILDDQQNGAPSLDLGVCCSTDTLRYKGYSVNSVYKIPKYQSNTTLRGEFEKHLMRNMAEFIKEEQQWKDYAAKDTSSWAYDCSKMANAYRQEINREEEMLTESLATPYVDRSEIQYLSKESIDKWESYKQQHLNSDNLK